MNRICPAPGTLSIGVAAHGNVNITVECLKSIFATVVGDFELLLIDDASPDDMLSLYRNAAEFHPNTRIYRFPENLEYTQSVNCLLNEASGERVLFVSNDIFITPSYVAALLEAMTDRSIGVARGVSNFVDNLLNTHNVIPDGPLATWDELIAFAAKQFHSAAEPIDDPFLIGDAFMVSGELLRAIGGFDLRFHGYLSDIDFGIRAVAAGYRRACCPRAFARHIKDANFHYLDAEERRRKIARRTERHLKAWTVFREIWGPDHLPAKWPGTHFIPFAELELRARDSGVRTVDPVSYSRYLIQP